MNMLDVINRGAYGLSDETRDNEYGCQERLAKAIYEMEQAIKMVNEESVFGEISLNAWNCFLHDEIPDTRQWDEKIARARS